MLDLLGIEISPARLKCALLSLDTLEHALAEAGDGCRSGSRTAASSRLLHVPSRPARRRTLVSPPPCRQSPAARRPRSPFTAMAKILFRHPPRDPRLDPRGDARARPSRSAKPRPTPRSLDVRETDRVGRGPHPWRGPRPARPPREPHRSRRARPRPARDHLLRRRHPVGAGRQDARGDGLHQRASTCRGGFQQWKSMGLPLAAAAAS